MLEERRHQVFLYLTTFFVVSMAMLNLVSITKFVQLGPLSLAVGALPYPLTFLCTDLISEFYGKKKATQVVWLGFVVNLFVILIMSIGEWLPSVPVGMQPSWQTLHLSVPVFRPDGSYTSDTVELFSLIHMTTNSAVFASMLAYLLAQFCDVHIFHFWKKRTGGRHLWLRNNASTMVSQFVDSVVVVLVTFGAMIWRGDMLMPQAFELLFSNYSFKFLAALIDTIPIYLAVWYLKRYLEIDPMTVHH